jgi:hypothetical protein
VSTWPELHAGTTFNYIWDVGSLSWIKSTGGGGGGGGPVTIADGADVAQGTTTDAAITSDASGTVIGFLRGLVKILASVWDSVNGRLKVDASAVSVPVTNAGLSFLDVALSTILKPADTLTKVSTVDTITNPVAITAVSLPLPTGAAIETGHLATVDSGVATLHTDLGTLDTDMTSRLGSVSRTPEAYTVMERLKYIDAKLANVATDATLKKLVAGLVKIPTPRSTGTFLHVGLR